MTKVRVGFVTSLNRHSGEGVITELDTQTTFTFFIDELTDAQKKTIRQHSSVKFEADPASANFIAVNLEETSPSYRKVI